MESNLQNFSHRHRENHHATPCLKLMSTRIFKGNLSEDGRFARRGLFKIHFGVGGGQLISTQSYVSRLTPKEMISWLFIGSFHKTLVT